jgi:hypothetical protein
MVGSLAVLSALLLGVVAPPLEYHVSIGRISKISWWGKTEIRRHSSIQRSLHMVRDFRGFVREFRVRPFEAFQKTHGEMDLRYVFDLYKAHQTERGYWASIILSVLKDGKVIYQRRMVTDYFPLQEHVGWSARKFDECVRRVKNLIRHER